MQFFPIGKVYDFMGLRVIAGLFSALLVIGSTVALFVPGPKLGTDFKGGTEVEVSFLAPVTDEQIRTAVDEAGFSSPDAIRVNDADMPHRFLIIARSEERRVKHPLQQSINLGAPTDTLANR